MLPIPKECELKFHTLKKRNLQKNKQKAQQLWFVYPRLLLLQLALSSTQCDIQGNFPHRRCLEVQVVVRNRPNSSLHFLVTNDVMMHFSKVLWSIVVGGLE